MPVVDAAIDDAIEQRRPVGAGVPAVIAHETEHRVLHQIERLVARAGRKFGHAQRAPLDAAQKLLKRARSFMRADVHAAIVERGHQAGIRGHRSVFAVIASLKRDSARTVDAGHRAQVKRRLSSLLCTARRGSCRPAGLAASSAVKRVCVSRNVLKTKLYYRLIKASPTRRAARNSAPCNGARARSSTDLSTHVVDKQKTRGYAAA